MLVSMLAAIPLAGAVEVTWVGGGHASNPQWSPDGGWVAFEVNNNADKVDLYVVKVQNGNPGQPQKLVIPGGSSMPLVPADALSGFCFSHAIISTSVFAGKPFLAMMTFASEGSSEIGSRSLRRSNGSV